MQKRAKFGLARAGLGLLLGIVLLTISCGGSLVEADRKADGGSVASSDTGSVALKPLREAEAPLAS